MISLIVCSRDTASIAAFTHNVQQTIGVAHEIIAINNSNGQYGICQAYNNGARQSKYNILCFVHEDLAFRTINWGQRVVAILADASIGVLGVAGGVYQPKVPSAYWSPGPEYLRMHVVHTVPGTISVIDLLNPDDQQLAEVAVADGVWLCSRRQVWQQHPFDEQTFPRFHFYDIDYCTAIACQYRICVTFEVVLEHFSKGSVNEQWLLAALDYQHKWASQLPFGPIILPPSTVTVIEKRALIEFITRLLDSNLPAGLIWLQLRRLATYGLCRQTLGLARRLIMRRYLHLSV